jgi:hypothetical protein
MTTPNIPSIGLVATVMVSNDTHWKAREASQVQGAILLEDCTLSFGILGTFAELATMLDRMKAALFTVPLPLENHPTETTEVSTHVN